jgi:hypothetical protein
MSSIAKTSNPSLQGTLRETTSTSVIVKNLTSDNYMEMLIDVGGCGKRVPA